MSRIRPWEHKQVRSDMRVLRANYRTVYLLYPTGTECTACGGVDEFTDSAYNPSCATCGGVGYTFSWATWQIAARIKQIDLVQLQAAGIPPGIEIGDAELYVSRDTKDAVERIMEESRAYVYFDGQRFRPTNVTADGVGTADEWRVELKRHSPEVRLTGY